MSDATYNLNGGFKPTTKRSADLNGPRLFPNTKMGDLRPHRKRNVQR
jgi:hypothetical protein